MTGQQDELVRLSQAMRGPDPYAVLADVRERSPLALSDGLVVTGRYAHCSRLLRHPRASSGWDRARISQGTRPASRNFLMLDPPDHTRLRRLVTKAFTPRVVSRLEPVIQEETDHLLDEIPGGGQVDVVADLASPLSMSIVCGLLGVPEADQPWLREQAAPLAQQLDPLPLRHNDSPAEVGTVRAGVIRYFAGLVERRRTTPADDLISHLIAVQADGDQLTPSELISTCILLLSAGHDTSAGLIGNGVLAMMTNAGQQELLANEEDHAPKFVEEVLRYDPPVQLVTRVATAEIDLDGFTVAKGDLVLMLIGAANRDPEVFPSPDAFDPDRDRTSSHLGFAAGLHFCLGAGLARLEAAIALRTIARRLVGPSPHPRGPLRRTTFSLRGPESLPIRVRALRGRTQR
ncbi:cytochrome P450 [Amycolatopsis speibonae]|uniref:Cytochrome P450 n=1 Tax=Amycolatopsis speibonae TaxID=1450224 RepID=A0ABV7PB46_9PSEU